MYELTSPVMVLVANLCFIKKTQIDYLIDVDIISSRFYFENLCNCAILLSVLDFSFLFF